MKVVSADVAAAGGGSVLVRAGTLYGAAEVPLVDAWLLVRDGLVTAVGAGELPAHVRELAAGVPELRLGGEAVAPGYIDMHCHGAAGYAFDEICAEDGAERVAGALAYHRAHGTTRQVLSLVTAPVDVVADRCEAAAALISKDPQLLGLHLEGPFLAAGKCGAHAPELLCAPAPEHVRRLLEASDGQLLQVTLAPELPHAAAAMRELLAAGVRVAVGHTEASYEQAGEAFACGATILTHAFNGMHGLQHRAPGPVAAASDWPEVTLEVIADGLHVHPKMLAVLQGLTPGRVALVSDAMAATGMPDGPSKVGDLAVLVRDGVSRLVGADGELGSIAGSTLTLERAVQRAIDAGWSPAVALAAASEVPARALGLGTEFGALRPGCLADFVVLGSGFDVREVWVAGRRTSYS